MEKKKNNVLPSGQKRKYKPDKIYTREYGWWGEVGIKNPPRKKKPVLKMA